MSNQDNVVIIGSGAAAVSAAKALRAGDAALKIDIYSDEQVPPYFRPSLTLALTSNPPEPRPMNKPEFYVNANIGLHLGMLAVKIDREAQLVIFSDDSKVAYGRLLIAVGAHCYIPQIPGIGLPEAMSLRNHKDLRRLQGFLEIPRNILVIGAGMLGLELAAKLLELNHRVTMVECAPGLLHKQLSATGGDFYEELIKDVVNMKIVTGSAVKEICGSDHVEGVNLADGRHFECDLVIISTGVISNADLAKQCGLESRHGIVVDHLLRTADPAIFAAGDCAEVECRNFGLWEPALAQGKAAAGTILGESDGFQCKSYGAFLNAFGTKVYSIGQVDGDDYSEVRDDEKKDFRKIFFGGGNVIGGFMIGDTSKMLQLSHAVNEQYNKTQAAEAGLL